MLYFLFAGGIAQLGERVVRNDEVTGPIPVVSTITIICRFGPEGQSGFFVSIPSVPLLGRAKGTGKVYPKAKGKPP